MCNRLAVHSARGARFSTARYDSEGLGTRVRILVRGDTGLSPKASHKFGSFRTRNCTCLTPFDDLCCRLATSRARCRTARAFWAAAWCVFSIALPRQDKPCGAYWAAASPRTMPSYWPAAHALQAVLEELSAPSFPRTPCHDKRDRS